MALPSLYSWLTSLSPIIAAIFVMAGEFVNICHYWHCSHLQLVQPKFEDLRSCTAHSNVDPMGFLKRADTKQCMAMYGKWCFINVWKSFCYSWSIIINNKCCCWLPCSSFCQICLVIGINIVFVAIVGFHLSLWSLSVIVASLVTVCSCVLVLPHFSIFDCGVP